MAEKTLSILDKIGSSLLATKTVGEKPSVLRTSGLVMTLDRQLPVKMGGKSFREQSGGVSLPSAEHLFTGDVELPAVDSQVSFTEIRFVIMHSEKE